MAKKTAAASPQLIRIAAPGSADLSKEQKAFNRLTKRIAKLETEVHAFRAAATRLRQRMQAEYRPLQQRHNDERARLVRVLDHAYQQHKLTKTERGKIEDLIAHACADLPGRGHPELQPIIERYAPPPLSEQEEAALDQQTATMMKTLYELQYGIRFDPAADVSTPEKFRDYVQQQLDAEEAEYQRQEAAAAERRARRKKSPKQQAAEEKKKAEAKSVTQAVRTLYLDLVKHLHPDRERDEAEKARKTELLQRVTTAYEAGELLTLLRLQLELNRLDQDHLENLAEAQLRYYNQLLRDQARELEAQLYEEQMELSNFTGRTYYFGAAPAALERDFEQQKSQLEAKIRQLAAEVLAFEHDPRALKAFLKTYKIPKPGPGPLLMPLW
ncbi:hypothetical protein EJV47_11230 [Hymenobacter gummosus]|uniref:J domain-containing protein n=1 Tax=Hymenobacter gummosus TaxID=1776032 RepID=A0A3S0K601_9BACT|nr:hypothetical protein [Hymenobacter gummosus]RTQ50199.1 hypothetical protein EJV47_11230 [Hymenobacter gummosus]